MQRAALPTYYTSFAVFLFAAIALIIPTGYSLGAVLLFIGAIFYIWRPAVWFVLKKEDWLIVGVLIFFCVVWVLEVVVYAQGVRYIDKPSRFLAAALVLPFLLRFPPRPAFFWSGLAIGSILTGSWSIWQKIVEEVSRAGGYTHTIQFGNISMLLGLLCLAGIGWALLQSKSRFWLVLLFLGFLMGFIGSILSGSRGGWVALPFAFLILYRGYADLFSFRGILPLLLILLVSVVLVFFLPQTGVRDRFHLAVVEVNDYLDSGRADSSVGARIEMWRVSLVLIAAKPMFGWGSEGYLRAKTNMAEMGELDQFVLQFNHPHNEFLDVMIKRGLFGLVALLLLYLVPLGLFYKGLRLYCLKCRSYAVAGAILTVAYFDFGMTQAFLSHNSGVMIYCFMLIVIWSLYANSQKIVR